MKKLRGNITITRVRGGDDKTPVSITIIDETSASEAIEVRLTLNDFAEAMLGLGHVKCGVKWNDSGRIGKKREHKTVMLTRNKSYSSDQSTEDAIIAPHEIDGWICDRESYRNHHNWCGDDKVATRFLRWV